MALAAETEDLCLEPARVLAGVAALLADQAKGLYFVAACGDRVVGQLMITFEWSDWRNGNIWWIQSVYVHKEWRGQGVFPRLFRHLQQQARADGNVCSLRLYMHHGNGRARKSYEALGMTRTPYEIYELEVPLSPR